MRPLAGVLCAGKGNFVLDGNYLLRKRFSFTFEMYARHSANEGATDHRFG